MKLLISLALLGVFMSESQVQGQLLDILNSGQTIIQGLGQEIPNIIPTPEELANLPLQLLAGLPEVVALTIVNQLCSVYLAADTIDPNVTPNMDEMSLRFHSSSCKELSFPLSHAEEIPDNDEFDVNKKVAIFVHGWNSNSEADYVLEMANAFNCRDDYNFLALNTGDSINTLYTWSSYNTEEVGRQLALALEKLVEKIPVENIHLIGHSLGAHIVGYAGRYFTKNTGTNLTRITGLDPANPCFNEGENLSGLQRNDAEFIDIIHSNPGGFGKPNAVGDVDFYPEGLAPIKPGCTQLGCSHSRSVEYFTESVYPGNENNFLAKRCTSLKKLNDGFCNGPEYPMGIATPYDLKGNYFLSVNAKSPYGKNNQGTDAIPSQCKLCESK
ncbi:vitellogenin-1-like [Cochliomyia hominivorax]